jgi:hypothetical protein
MRAVSQRRTDPLYDSGAEHLISRQVLAFDDPLQPCGFRDHEIMTAAPGVTWGLRRVPLLEASTASLRRHHAPSGASAAQASQRRQFSASSCCACSSVAALPTICMTAGPACTPLRAADPIVAPEPWPICTTMGAVADNVDGAELDPDFVTGKRALAAENWRGAIAALKLAALREPQNADIQNYIGLRLSPFAPAGANLCPLPAGAGAQSAPS